MKMQALECASRLQLPPLTMNVSMSFITHVLCTSSTVANTPATMSFSGMGLLRSASIAAPRCS